MATLNEVAKIKEISLDKFLAGIKKRDINSQARAMLITETRDDAKHAYKKAKNAFPLDKVKFDDKNLTIHYKGLHTVRFMCSNRADRDLHAPLRRSRYNLIYKLY